MPERVGRYQIDGVLGRGAMGVVFSAHDPVLDRKVAVKLLDREPSAERRARMVREAQALARLAHPNVLTVLDVGEADGRIFVTMELVEGQTLWNHLRDETRPWSDTLALFVAAGRGLAAAHRAGVVHGDFKPHNVMVDGNGRVRVVDFGLARLLESDTEFVSTSAASTIGDRDAIRLTKAGAGTPAYMAAEQWEGKAADARSDQFAFCVSLWEALWGERPFSGESMMELGVEVVEGRLRSPPVRRRIPRPIRSALERGLQADPGRRWPDMETLLDALATSKRWSKAALVVVVLGLGVAALAPLVAREVARTREGHRVIQAAAACAEIEVGSTVWDDTARQRVRDGLIDSGAAYAPATVDRIEAIVDRQASAFSRLDERLCTAQHVEQSLTAEQAEQARTCLEQHRSRLGTLIDKWSSATKRDVETAVSDALTNESVSRCLEPDFLRTRSIIAELPESTAQRLRYFETMPGLTFLTARRPQQGTEYRPTKVDEFEQAYLLALELDLDELAARAALGLFQIHGHGRQDWREARRWEELARASAARVPNSRVHDEIELVTATLEMDRRNPAAALQTLRGSIAAAERSLGSEHPAVGRVLINASNAARDAGRLEEAKRLSQRAVGILETALGPEHPHVLVARLSGVQLDEASLSASDPDLVAKRARIIETYEAILPPLTKAFGADSTAVAMTLDNLANQLSHEPQRALELNEQALEIWGNAIGFDDPRAARSIANYGAHLASVDRWTEAVEAGERALAALETSLGASHVDVQTVLVQLGGAYVGAGQHERAREALQRAVDNLRPDDHELRARAQSHLAHAELGLGNRTTAAQHAAEALALYVATARSEQVERLDRWIRSNALRLPRH